jgi:hypothetical protein
MIKTVGKCYPVFLASGPLQSDTQFLNLIPQRMYDSELTCGSHGKCVDPGQCYAHHVTSSGSHKGKGCFLDDPSNRVLRNGSTQDSSATGMTVEKCLDSAQSWRYAGLEFGGECFWGDVLYREEPVSQDDCKMACAGDSLESCGDGNRIELLEDSEWVNPSRAQLADSLEAYETFWIELQSDIVQWKKLVDAYTVPGRKHKRDDIEMISLIHDRILQRRVQNCKSLTKYVSQH